MRDATAPPSRSGDRTASRSHFSLRLRLTLWVVLIFTVILWTTGLVFWLYQRASIQDMFEAALENKAAPLAQSVAEWMPDLTFRRLELLSRGQLRWGILGREWVWVLDDSGASVMEDLFPSPPADRLPLEGARSSGEAQFTRLALELLPSSSADATSAAAIVYPFQHEQRTYFLVIAASDAYAHRQLALITRVLLLAGLIGPVAAAVAGWFIAGVAVAPLDRVTRLARHLGPETLQEETPLDEGESAEVVRLAQELDDAKRRISTAFNAQERFLSNVSHEIKTPISVLLLEAQTMPREGLPDEAREFLSGVEEEMIRLGKLVESFLTLTRVKDGKGLPRELECMANELVMDSVEHCNPMAEQYRVRLTPRLLDEPDADTVVRGEPELLRTMIDNLVRNAIRFSPRGENIDVAMRVADACLEIGVGDAGPGIPPDQLEVIFDRFAQAEGEQRRGRGHGLGLEIAQGIAELHGGRILAQNREGGGAVFTVRLPLAGLNGQLPHHETDADDAG